MEGYKIKSALPLKFSQLYTQFFSWMLHNLASKSVLDLMCINNVKNKKHLLGQIARPSKKESAVEKLVSVISVEQLSIAESRNE